MKFVFLTVNDPADAHITEVEVALFAVRTLPSLRAHVQAVVLLTTLAPVREVHCAIALPPAVVLLLIVLVLVRIVIFVALGRFAIG